MSLFWNPRIDYIGSHSASCGALGGKGVFIARNAIMLLRGTLVRATGLPPNKNDATQRTRIAFLVAPTTATTAVVIEIEARPAAPLDFDGQLCTLKNVFVANEAQIDRSIGQAGEEEESGSSAKGGRRPSSDL